MLKEPYSVAFEELARTFQALLDNPYEKSLHMVKQIQAYAVQAGRLLRAAVDAGHFSDDPWWRTDPIGGWVFSVREHEHGVPFFLLWKFTVGSWLCKNHPERMRDKAGSLDWQQGAKDRDGRPVFDENGRRVFAHELYDAKDAMAHVRARALVYADACRLLAQLVRAGSARLRTATKKPAKRMPRTIPTENELRALELRSRGFTYGQGGKEMGISKSRFGQLVKSGGRRSGSTGRSVNLGRTRRTHA